ncbi:hypothetical protein [Bdellovibrio sp. KM01]|uniref:hypothetical protein n=1 Tax=Bdellovibrio sp. KM01 TaxID=2748865 RepID=UPI0015E9E835|nr:hypothetical protein [Bdellovibrio sp. KM01]QLY25248.1 hypothetical protein HW988_17815 [Bdellovibrio sp. KM01]
MRILVLILSVFCSAQALAMTSSEMRAKGCIPFRQDDGTITMKCKAPQYQVSEVITEINGKPVDSPAKAMELYQSQKASTMSIERVPKEARGINEETTDNN